MQIAPRNKKNCRILFVAGSGGHAAQMLLLLKQFQEYDCQVLLEKTDHLTLQKLNQSDVKVFTMPILRGKNEILPMTLLRIIQCFFASFFIVLKSNPHVVLSTGPGLVIPIAFYSKLFGKKIIHIESWSRVNSKSYTGKVMYRLANIFFVQWPSLAKKYDGSVFAGRIDALKVRS